MSAVDALTLVARRQRDCTAPGPGCDVATMTVLGYYPNLGSGYFFTIAFGLCLVGTIVLGVTKRTWTFMGALTAGLILETAGMIHPLPPVWRCWAFSFCFY